MNSISHYKSRNLEVLRELHEITFNYTKEMEETFEFLRDSKDYLEFKKIKKDIGESTYSVRMKSLMNMALTYFYSVYEAFTRTFFAKVMHYDEGMSIEYFNSEFHKLHELRKRVIKKKYQIRLPNHIFRVLRLFQTDRNDIVHLGKKAKPEFENIEYFFRVIAEYFEYIEKEIFSRLS